MLGSLVLLVPLDSLVPLTLSDDSVNGNVNAKVKVVFNDPLSNDRPLDECKSGICLELLRVIEEARYSIDFAMYGFRKQERILNALKEAKSRGVMIRGVVDMDLSNSNYYEDTVRLMNEIGDVKTDYDVDVRSSKKSRNFRSKYCDRVDGFKGYVQCVGHSLDDDRCIISSQASRDDFPYNGDIMHNKFFIVDDRIVWTGSANISDSGIGGYNANTVIVIDNEDIALGYKKEFMQMYNGKFHNEKKSNGIIDVKIGDSIVTLGFSPKDKMVRNRIKDLILEAKESIDVSVFYFTSKELTMYLNMAKMKGVKVRVIIDATSAQNGYSKHKVLRGSGIDVKVENWGSKLHSKTAVIDEKIVIGGSMNWTSAGEWSNDENVVIIRDERIAKEASKFFEYMWDSIDDRWLDDEPNPESKDSGSSCYDGVDNDFDGLVDMEDSGCRSDEKLDNVPRYWIVEKKEGNGLIKGNINSKGKKIYHSPKGEYYSKTRIDESKGERWFCSDYEARFYGWRRSFK